MKPFTDARLHYVRRGNRGEYTDAALEMVFVSRGCGTFADGVKAVALDPDERGDAKKRSCDVDGKVRLVRGNVVILPHKFADSFIMDGGDTDALYYFALSRYPMHTPEFPTVVDCSRDADLIEAILKTLEAEMRGDMFDLKMEPYREGARSHLKDSLAYILVSSGCYDDNSVRRRARALTLIKEYMDNHYGTVSTIRAACEEIGMPRESVTRLFRAEMGISPSDYLSALRMKKATQQIETTDDSIDAIATSCGYCNAAYFCYLFKEAHGIAPLAYRARLKEERALAAAQQAKHQSPASEKDM